MSDGLSREELMQRSRGNLVDVILAQIGQVTQLQKELATATWQAQLLADQRDHVLRWCKDRETEGTVRIWDLYSILITDPRDADVLPGSGVPAQPIQFHERSFDAGGYSIVYPTCVCGAQWLEQANRCVAAPATMIVTRRE